MAEKLPAYIFTLLATSKHTHMHACMHAAATVTTQAAAAVAATLDILVVKLTRGKI